ncbi:MAG: acyltransferase domain-containing protein, partial [Cyanobacteria bacterium P01_D01_bin.56]
VGEYVAACVAGVFSLADGLKLIAKRGQLMGQLPAGGTMVSVMASAQRVREIIETQAEGLVVSIAALNGPESTVISGESSAVERVVTELETQEIKTKALAVSHAFHSSLMEPMLAEFRQVAEAIDYSEPTMKLISNVTGEVIRERVSRAEYWCEHIVRPVNFVGGMATLEEQACSIMLECGPTPILLGMARQCLGEREERLWLPSLRKQQADWQQLLTSVSQLYLSGIVVDWLGFERGYPQRRKISLPTYPFQRQRYWVEAASDSGDQADGFGKTLVAQLGTIHGSNVEHPLLGHPLMAAAHRSGEHLWLSMLEPRSPSSDLEGYSLLGSTGLSVGAYVEMALAAANAALGMSKNYRLSDLQLHTPLVPPEDNPCPVQVLLVEQSSGPSKFQVYSQTDSSQSAQQLWVLHASANIHRA